MQREGAVDVRQDSAIGADDRKLGELFSDLSRDVSILMRQEVDLAKAEIREEAAKAGKAAGLIGGGALIGLLSLLLLAFAAAWGLSEIVPEGVGFLIVGVICGIAAAVLFLIGRSRLRRVRPVPDETVETLKEDMQWARAQLK